MKIERVGDVATAEIPEIREVNVIQLRRGDTLVVTCDRNAEVDLYTTQEVFSDLLPEGVGLVIVEGMRFDVIRPPEDGE